MSASNFQLMSSVRRILSRRWIDLGEVRFGCFSGTVRVQGVLRRLGSMTSEPMSGAVVADIEEEIRRLKAVRMVHFDLSNWIRDAGGEWVNLDQSPANAEVQEIDSVESFVMQDAPKSQDDTE